MEWFFDTLRKYPELAIFLTLGLGYWIGCLLYTSVVTAIGRTLPLWIRGRAGASGAYIRST